MLAGSLLLATSLAGAAPMDLRQAMLAELRADQSDPVGPAAADFLERSGIALAIGATPAGLAGRPAAAFYDEARRAILVEPSFASSYVGKVLARRLAPTIVHEAEHARAAAEAPGAPAMREGELAAYAAEAVFVRRRLARDSAYAGLRAVETRARGAAAPQDWWRKPIPRGKAKSFIALALPGARDQAAALHWFAARAGAAGAEGLARAYDEAGLLESLPPSRRACTPAQPPSVRLACGKAAKRLEARWSELARLLRAP